MTERRAASLEGEAALAAMLSTIPERQLQERLRRLCLACGLSHYHPYRSQKSQQGWPDSVVLRPPDCWPPPYLVFVEVKRQAGRVTPAQRLWGRLLSAVERATDGVVCYRLVRPADFAELEALLLSGACPSGEAAREA